MNKSWRLESAAVILLGGLGVNAWPIHRRSSRSAHRAKRISKQFPGGASFGGDERFDVQTERCCEPTTTLRNYRAGDDGSLRFMWALATQRNGRHYHSP